MRDAYIPRFVRWIAAVTVHKATLWGHYNTTCRGWQHVHQPRQRVLHLSHRRSLADGLMQTRGHELHRHRKHRGMLRRTSGYHDSAAVVGHVPWHRNTVM
jgi:hypothetical protein